MSLIEHGAKTLLHLVNPGRCLGKRPSAYCTQLGHRQPFLLALHCSLHASTISASYAEVTRFSSLLQKGKRDGPGLYSQESEAELESEKEVDRNRLEPGARLLP